MTFSPYIIPTSSFLRKQEPPNMINSIIETLNPPQIQLRRIQESCGEQYYSHRNKVRWPENSAGVGKPCGRIAFEFSALFFGSVSFGHAKEMNKTYRHSCASRNPQM